MKIILDALGSDAGSSAALAGAELARAAFSDVEVVLLDSGDEITMHDDPKLILGAKKESTMGRGLQLLANGEGDAFVTGGSTAAFVMGATMLVGRIKGIKRPALAPVMPSAKGAYMLLDVGANVECRPQMLLQFAIMGSIYTNSILGIHHPRVGLINVGVEETKGTPLQLEAFELLQQASELNFEGNIEARELIHGGCDVAVCDGFTGNVVLKTQEGMGGYFNGFLKGMFAKSLKTKAAASLVMSDLREFRKKMDYTEYGGALLLGIKKPVIKAHGSSDPKAFFNAIRQARECVLQNVVGKIEEATDN